MLDQHLLTFLLVTPLLGALTALFFPRDEPAGVIGLGFVVAALNCVWATFAWFRFDEANTSLQMAESFSWFDAFGISYSLGIDSISLGLVMLTALLFPLVLLSSRPSMGRRAREWVACLLLLEVTVMGALLAVDLFLFYVCFEAMLLPSLVLMLLHGDAKAAQSARKFFIYTMLGSMLLLVALLMTAQLARAGDPISFSWVVLTERLWARPQGPVETWLFLGFAVAFAIKVALFPLHTWMPSAYRSAPAPVCALLSAILLKVGAYGFLRHALWLFPRAASVWLPALGVLAAVTIVWGALLASGSQDVKELFAYSSMSHLGFVILGIASMTQMSVMGGMVEMLSHGLVTGGLFLMLGFLEMRLKTTDLREMGGLARGLPHFTCFFSLFALASVGLPGLSGFVGEFLVLVGSYQAPLLAVSLTHRAVMIGFMNGFALLGAACVLFLIHGLTASGPTENKTTKNVSLLERSVWTTIAFATFALFVAPPVRGFDGGLVARWVRGSLSGGDEHFLQTARLTSLVALSGVVFSALYVLRFLRMMVYGPPRPRARSLGDLGARETWALMPLVIGIVWLGIFPQTMGAKLDNGISAYVRAFRAQAHMSPERVLLDAQKGAF